MTQKGFKLASYAIYGVGEPNLITTTEKENFTKKITQGLLLSKKSSFGKVPAFTLDSCL